MRDKKSLISSGKCKDQNRDAAERAKGKDPDRGWGSWKPEREQAFGDAGSKIWPGNRMTVGSRIRVSRAEKAQEEISPSWAGARFIFAPTFFTAKRISGCPWAVSPTDEERFILLDTKRQPSVLKKTQERMFSPFQRCWINLPWSKCKKGYKFKN